MQMECSFGHFSVQYEFYISSLEPKMQWPWALVHVCCIWGFESYQFIPIVTLDPRLTLTYFMAISNLISNAFTWE